MPIRIPRPGKSEIAVFSLAGASAFAPFYMLLPGAEERLAAHTARWAPRWERNISYFTPAAERSIQRVTPSIEKTVQRVAPPIEKTVKRIDARLPLEKVAKRMHSNLSPSA